MKKIDGYFIRSEREEDYRAVENLTREAFYNVYRQGCLEHFVLHEYRTRADFIKELDLLLEEDGEIIAHVMFSKATISTKDKKELPIVTFGPFSVMPCKQNKGYGATLLNHALSLAANLGYGAVAITGNYDYYKKYGFVKGKEIGIYYAYDYLADYFLIKELKNGYLRGVEGEYKDPEGYAVDEAAAEAFDRTFPPKEKIKKEGQIF